MLRQSHTKAGSRLSDRSSDTFYSSVRPFFFVQKYPSGPERRTAELLLPALLQSNPLFRSELAFWKFMAARPHGGGNLAGLLGSGSSMSICPRRSLCKHDQSPDQSKRSKPRLVWLSLLTVWPRVCSQGSTDETDDTAACTDFFIFYLIYPGAYLRTALLRYLSRVKEWHSTSYSVLHLQMHKSALDPAHTLSRLHTHIGTLSQAQSGSRSREGMWDGMTHRVTPDGSLNDK